MDNKTLDKGYEPKAVEERWAAYWEENESFKADAAGEKGYAIVIPPPNVTGVLHMGHALNATLQDILCRYQRLQGVDVLWIPGTDHAGIATQNVVERKLAEEGLDRRDLGREKFIARVWKWRKEYGRAIINQLKRLGASCDWSRERFTMDEGLSRAVRKVFVDLYDQGLIYKGDYIINWCHRCHTALSDLEVEHEPEQGKLYYIRYPWVNGDGEIIVATTRPETMLGDTAVAVNPGDERYTAMHGKKVLLPLMNREIPIIAETYVDMSFGTGGLKVTPAHDPNDFLIGEKHGLPRIKVIGDNGLMNEAAGRFAGLDVVAAREAVAAALKQENLLVQTDDHEHSVGHCYRCRSVVEPNLSRQWFVRTGPLAAKAAAAVRKGNTRLVPAGWDKSYFSWMDSIRDWCISRQIWWGHRIPAWNCDACGKMTVLMEDPKTCPRCDADRLVQETDVLDTWFSSALWPFSTMGWPDRTELLKKYYPTSVLVTGFDIIFFWVARMMMMGIHFMEAAPFHDVYVHALVRDKYGDKMSKSKGNVIDPLEVMDQYGTDAFRYTLAASAAQGRDIRMDEKRVEGYRHFINKIWNAARFALMYVEASDDGRIDHEKLELPDRWILSRLAQVIRTVSAALDAYRFNEAAGGLYRFVWHSFCDWYLEAVKPTLYGENGDDARQTTRRVLEKVLADVLILLHPFAPYVSEEIWSKLPGREGSLQTASWPVIETMQKDTEAEREMTLMIDLVTGIRNIRGEMDILPTTRLKAFLISDTRVIVTVNRYKALIERLAGLSELSLHSTRSEIELPKTATTTTGGDVKVYVDLDGIVDFKKEIERLDKKCTKLRSEIEKLEKKLNNQNFLQKAPPEIVKEIRARYSKYENEYDSYDDKKKTFEKIELRVRGLI